MTAAFDSVFRPIVRCLCVVAAVALLGAAGSRADYYAAQDGQTPASPYTSWTTAASNVQDAVDAATNGATVWVGAGTYSAPAVPTNFAGTNVVYVGKQLSLRGATGDPEDVVIDGGGLHRGIAVVYDGLAEVLIEGLTVSGCRGTTMGGGILFYDPISSYFHDGWTGTVRNCVIEDNVVTHGPAVGYYLPEGAEGGGLGFYARSSSLLNISNCLLRSNTATNEVVDPVSAGGSGGGLYYSTYGGECTVQDSALSSNVAYRGAGAMIVKGTVMFDRCEIAHGILRPEGGQSFGGGVFVVGGDSLFRNCLMRGNDSGGRGGAINNESRGSNTVFEVESCTIADNMRGIYIRSWSVAQGSNPSLLMRNCVLRSNTYGDFWLPEPVEGYAHAAPFCCYSPTNSANLAWGPGSITNAPAFVDAAAGSYRLKSDSPCVNAGTNDAWMAEAKDLDGNPRLHESVVDMGCYEYSPQGPIVRIR